MYFLREDKISRRQEDKKTRRQEDTKTRRQEDKKTRRQENKRTGGQKDKKTRGQRTGKRGHGDKCSKKYRLLGFLSCLEIHFLIHKLSSSLLILTHFSLVCKYFARNKDCGV